MKTNSQEIFFQKIEMLALFLVATGIYFLLDLSLWIYLGLLFSFDISMIGYVKDNKLGALVYNTGHSLFIPLIILLIGYYCVNMNLIGFSLIWFAHIGVDRFLGYGLKLTSNFKDTHLGEIERYEKII